MAISISTALNADAQPVESFRASTNITPQVESFQIAKSGNLTPSLYTGAMTYSLPLYIYSDPDFNIPISLEYNYDGYKVARSAGTVGLGWALNYGGVITREIRGLKDEYVQENYDGDYHTRYGFFWAYKKRLPLNSPFTINRPWTDDLEIISTPAELVRYLNDDLYEDYPVSTYGDSYDLSPDLFHFSFGPYSGDFIMNNNGTLTLTSSTHPQGELEVTVESTLGMGGTSLKFTIKTGDGYEYTFGDTVNAREYHISHIIKDECSDDTNLTGTMSGWTDTAWKLTKIKAPNGRMVLFSYTEKPTLTPTVTYSYSTYTRLLPTSEAMPTPRDSVPSWERTNLNYGYSHPIEQIRICGADGSRTESTVSFSWANKTSSEDEMSALNYESTVAPSYLNSHPLQIRNVKLSAVTIKNIDSEFVKSIQFSQSSIGSTSGPQRMVLVNVSDSQNGKWYFDYDRGTGSLPEYDSKRHDIWGFWCEAYMDPRQKASWDDLIQSTPNFVERLDYLKSGSLRMITYPTGGWSEISYERNEADYALNRTSQNLPRLDYWYKECGGLRVKEILSKSFESGDRFKRSYEYSNGEILSLRWMRIDANYWKHWGWSERTYLKGIFYSNDGLSNGSYDNMIGYRQVKEILPDESYIVYQFNGFEEYPDLFMITTPHWMDANTSPETTDVSATDEGVSLMPKLVSPEQIFSDFRGKIKSIEEYNSTGQIRKKTTYGYTTLAGLSEYRFFNMMIGWLSFFQNRFYPKLSDIDETHYEPSYGATSKMSFNTHYTYDRQTGQLLSESSGTVDKYRTTEYVYCSSNPTASDACTLKAAVSDVITRIRENDSTLYTGRFHFGYQPEMEVLSPVSLTEYIIDIPSSDSPSNANSKVETTAVTYDSLLRPTKVDMPGDAYIKYDWDNTGKYIIRKTVNSEEGKTEYTWKDLIGLTSIKDPTGQITRYEYNDKGKLTGVRDSDSSLVVSYDTHLWSEGGSSQNRKTILRHLSEGDSVMVGESEFYNGLGYLFQTISESKSGNGDDLITNIEYDSMFRPDSKSYLPYPRKVGIWSSDNNSVINQRQWYLNKYSTQRPFMERTFENGSSGRPLTEQKPGNIYQTSNKKIHFSYSLNDSSDSIFTFRYDYPASTSDYPSVACTGKYQEGTLSKTTVISEDNDTTQTFTDAAGRLVLERRLNEGIRHDTYRIYDLRDSVVCVIQPIGSSGLYNGKGMPFNGTFVQDSCFTWQYDGKGRMTESHTPGAGIKRFAYDLSGRMVYMDDSNLAELNKGKYYKYDKLNRITEEGVCSSPDISIIRSSLASNRSISNIVSKAKTIRLFSYYSIGNTNNYSNLSFQPIEGIASNEDISYERCKGLLSYEKVWEAPNYGVPYSPRELNTSSRYVERAYWYNKKGRMIQKAEKTDDGWISRYSIKYDFAGNILNIMEMHTTPQEHTDSMLTTNTYDKRGRLLSYNRVLNGNDLAKVQYSYDWNGLLVNKVVNKADATMPLLEESYERSLLGRLSRIIISAEHADSLFTEELYYTNPGAIASPRYDGKLSMTSVRTQNLSPMQCTYTYDNIGRLIGSKRHASGMDIGIGTEKDIKYDLNGNITRTTRSSGSEIGTYSYQMLYGYTGNRLSNGNTSIYNNYGSDPMRPLNFSYDKNGNMTVVAGSTEIKYNILNLPYITGHQTFTYLSDGTKTRVSDLTKEKLKLGNFVYERMESENSSSLSNISFRDGVIVINDNDLSKMSDLWFVKDHIGSIRSVYCLNDNTGNPIIEYNHFLPYGTRLDFLATEKSALNSHRFAGKKEYDDFLTSFDINPMDILANDFGPRFFIPFTSCWTTPDPLASKYPSISPYTYCMSDPINYVDPFGLTTYVAGNHMYVINDGSQETIYLSRRQYQRLLNQMYDPDGHYWSMRQSIMDRNGYTDAAGNQVLAASQITSGINSSFYPLSISSSILSILGGSMKNSPKAYHILNSKHEFDFQIHKSARGSNQFIRRKKVSTLGRRLGASGNTLGIIDLGISVTQLSEAENLNNQVHTALDLTFGVVGFIPEIGPVTSLIWSLGGSTLFDSYTNMILQQIDTTTGRISPYFYITDY